MIEMSSEIEKMFICPKCGTKLKARKILLLTNFNTITCPTCASKLRMKNTDANRAVSVVIGGVGAGFGALLGILLVQSGFNLVYWGLEAVWIVGIFLVSWFLHYKFVELKIELPRQMNTQLNQGQNR